MGKAHLMQTGMTEANLSVGQGQNINVHIQHRSNNSWRNLGHSQLQTVFLATVQNTLTNFESLTYSSLSKINDSG